MSEPDWTCDKCDRPIKMGFPNADGRYTIMDDPENKRGRHHSCNPTKADLDRDFKRVKENADKALRLLSELRGRMR